MSSLENAKLLQPPWCFVKPGVTEEEYFAWSDEDSHFELIDGVLYVNSPEGLTHNEHRQFIQVLLRHFCEETGFGRVLDVNFPLHLASCRIFEPDILVVSHRRADQLSEKQVEAPVELVVEVLSPHNRPHDMAVKRPRYRQARIGELWIVDGHDRRIEVDQRVGKGYRSFTRARGRLRSAAVRGFWIDVGWLWESPLPSTLACTLRILGRTPDS